MREYKLLLFFISQQSYKSIPVQYDEVIIVYPVAARDSDLPNFPTEIINYRLFKQTPNTTYSIIQYCSLQQVVYSTVHTLTHIIYVHIYILYTYTSTAY